MYEYHKEHLIESSFDVKSAELSELGWRLISVVINPLLTAEESPIYVTFWERLK